MEIGKGEAVRLSNHMRGIGSNGLELSDKDLVEVRDLINAAIEHRGSEEVDGKTFKGWVVRSGGSGSTGTPPMGAGATLSRSELMQESLKDEGDSAIGDVAIFGYVDGLPVEFVAWLPKNMVEVRFLPNGRDAHVLTTSVISPEEFLKDHLDGTVEP